MGGQGAGSRIRSMLLSGLALGMLGLLEPLIRFWPRFHALGASWWLIVLLYLAFGVGCALAAGIVVDLALAARAAQRRPVVWAAYHFTGAAALAGVLVLAPLLRREFNTFLTPVSYWALYPVLAILGYVGTIKLAPHIVQPVLAALIAYPSGRIARSRVTLVLAVIGLLIALTAYKGLQAGQGHTGRAPRAGLQSRPGDQPAQNLILITIGGLRADHLGAYGYARPTSPALDALAARGVTFERCFTQCTQSTTSLATVLTSLYPATHGVREAPQHPSRLAEEHDTLAEALRDAGLRCVGLFNGPGLSRESGLVQGFDEIAEFSHGRLDLFPWRYLAKLGWVSPPRRIPQSELFRAEDVIDEAVRRLSSLRDRPFFLYLHLADVQQPFIPPDPFASAFLSSGASPIDAAELWRKRWSMLRKLPAEEVLPPPDFLRFVDMYDGAIRYTDEQLARLVAELERLGLAERTLLLVTSERGTELLDHGRMLNHSELLYDELIHVPLIASAPWLPAGRRVEEIVQLVDLLPTALAIFDLPPAREARGRSLLPLLSGVGGWRASAAYSESQTHAGLRTRDRKVITSRQEADGPHCFDLILDPEESRVAPPQDAAACDSLVRALEELRRSF